MSEFIIEQEKDALNEREYLKELEKRIENIEKQLGILVKRKIKSVTKILNRDEYDINNDGVFDSKDASDAGKILAQSRKLK